jgi:hypothetical protein
VLIPDPLGSQNPTELSYVDYFNTSIAQHIKRSSNVNKLDLAPSCYYIQ